MKSVKFHIGSIIEGKKGIKMKNNIFSVTILKLCIALLIGFFLSAFFENGFLIPTIVMIVGIDLIVDAINNLKK